MTMTLSSLEAVLADQLDYKRAIGASLLSPTQKASRLGIRLKSTPVTKLSTATTAQNSQEPRHENPSYTHNQQKDLASGSRQKKSLVPITVVSEPEAEILSGASAPSALVAAADATPQCRTKHASSKIAETPLGKPPRRKSIVINNNGGDEEEEEEEDDEVEEEEDGEDEDGDAESDRQSGTTQKPIGRAGNSQGEKRERNKDSKNLEPSMEDVKNFIKSGIASNAFVAAGRLKKIRLPERLARREHFQSSYPVSPKAKSQHHQQQQHQQQRQHQTANHVLTSSRIRCIPHTVAGRPHLLPPTFSTSGLSARWTDTDRMALAEYDIPDPENVICFGSKDEEESNHVATKARPTFLSSLSPARQYLMTGHRLSVINRYEIDEVELERLREAARVRAVSVHYGIDPHHGHLRHHGQHGVKSNGRASGTTRVSQSTRRASAGGGEAVSMHARNLPSEVDPNATDAVRREGAVVNGGAGGEGGGGVIKGDSAGAGLAAPPTSTLGTGGAAAMATGTDAIRSASASTTASTQRQRQKVEKEKSAEIFGEHDTLHQMVIYHK